MKGIAKYNIFHSGVVYRAGEVIDLADPFNDGVAEHCTLIEEKQEDVKPVEAKKTRKKAE